MSEFPELADRARVPRDLAVDPAALARVTSHGSGGSLGLGRFTSAVEEAPALMDQLR
ncbi:hypothetical protein [Streptomyces sp. NPDC001652]|uniref:hypothetical protein n=1 Tax=Streptomyces sp. NPDC001652 TaxID=3154393 RepID=UPI00331CD0DE